jgi:ribosome assembly protein YihI (activator of Der GTPase)
MSDALIAWLREHDERLKSLTDRLDTHQMHEIVSVEQLSEVRARADAAHERIDGLVAELADNEPEPEPEPEPAPEPEPEPEIAPARHHPLARRIGG